MTNGTTYSQKKLAEELAERKRKNLRYSLRSFSKFLGLAPTVLSEVLRGKRKIPKKSLNMVAEKLNLSSIESRLFFHDVLYSDFPLYGADIEKVLNDEKYFKVISEWEHYAIIELFGLSDFQPDVNWITNQLGISRVRVEVCIDHLLSTDLLKMDDKGKLSRNVGKFSTTRDIPSAALVKAHAESLELAREKLTSIPLELRDYSSSTISINPENIPQAKQLIRDFRQQLTTILAKGNCQAVYQISVQFFPLTKINNKEI